MSPLDRPSTFVRWLTPTLLGMVVLGAAGLIWVGWTIAADPHPGTATVGWARRAFVAGCIMLVAGVSGLIFVVMRWPVAGRVAWFALFVAAAANAATAFVGLDEVTEAERLGGDWGALHVMTAWVFNVAAPAFLGLLSAAAGWMVRRAAR